MTLYFVQLDSDGIDRCEYGDDDYLYDPCVISEKKYKTFKKKLDKINGLNLDFSCGAHGCVIEIEKEQIMDNLTIKKITQEKLETMEEYIYIKKIDDDDTSSESFVNEILNKYIKDESKDESEDESKDESEDEPEDDK